MNIALDYDGTFTADQAFWKKFVALAEDHGHRVRIVTCRKSDDIDDVCEFTGLSRGRVFCTSGQSKMRHMEQWQIKIDVWIDDSPEMVLHGV